LVTAALAFFDLNQKGRNITVKTRRESPRAVRTTASGHHQSFSSIATNFRNGVETGQAD
jgi:hypothetical protein